MIVRPNYHPAIDGLRGIAVLSVVMFHINPALMPGGFIGVDVFFVISGFLISLNITSEVNDGRFSITDFYRRRVKRIVPALLTVVGVTTFVAQILLLPEDARRAAESGLWSLVSLPNVYFWLFLDTSYFAANSMEKPLLHLWSLGVEEQFYLVWPLILMAGYRAPLIAIIAFSGAAAACSFAFAEWLYPLHASFSYYMLPTRVGELLVGAIAAFLVFKGSPLLRTPAAIEGVATAGGILLLGALLLVNENMLFPGWIALLPTLGAALLIYADHCGPNWISSVLCRRPALWFGLVSYSAYLWHWPLLAFYRYGYGSVGIVSGAIIFIMSFTLAWATYRWVETPARQSSGSARKVIVTQFAVPAVALAVACLAAMKLDGYELRSNMYRERLALMRDQTKPAYAYDYVCQRQRLTVKDITDPRCVTGKGEPTVVLWGDSNAAHYVGMLTAFAERAGFGLRNIEIGSCPPIDGDPATFVNAHRLDDCRHSLSRVRPLVDSYSVVIIAAAWTGYEDVLGTVYATAKRLADGGRLVILLGKSPVVSGFDRECRQKALTFPGAVCSMQPVKMSSKVLEVNRALRDFALRTKNVEYFDATDFLCPGGECALENAEGQPVYFDSNHLTMRASWELGRSIIARSGVPQPFLLAARWKQ